MRVSSLAQAVALVLAWGTIPVLGQDGPNEPFSADAIRFFENEVRPVLLDKCATCHNDKLLASGLSIESRETILRGGHRGEAASPGLPEDSLLVRAIRRQGDLKMPPGGPLAERELSALIRWVEMGLPWPARRPTSATVGEPGSHWSFQPIRRHAEPKVADASWPRNPIDRFILARLDKQGLQPAPEATRPTLIHRLYIDLIGLLPTPDEVDDFANDSRPNAYEHVVDHLLDLLTTANVGAATGLIWPATPTPTDTTTTANARSGCTANG